MDFSYIFSNKDEIGVGFHIKQIKTNLVTENLLGTKNDFYTAGANIVFYGKYKLLRWNFLGIDIGSRINLASASGSKKINLFEPRFSMTLKPFSFLALKGAVGVYQQELIRVTDENEVINLYEPWIIVPSYLNPLKAIHYIGGIEKSLNKFDFSVKSYYKQIKNMPLINDKKVLFNDPDFIEGTGESSGLEFLLKYESELFDFTSLYTYFLHIKKLMV